MLKPNPTNTGIDKDKSRPPSFIIFSSLKEFKESICSQVETSENDEHEIQTRSIIYSTEAEKLLITFQLPNENILFYLGSFGWFPIIDSIQITESPRSVFIEFEKRDYTIAHPKLTDLDELLNLEKEAWSTELRANRSQISERIKSCSSEIVILKIDQKICGALYSQRINAFSDLKGLTVENIHKAHKKDGKLAEFIAICTRPEIRSFGYGDQLLEFMIEYSRFRDGIQSLFAVSLCGSYDSGNSENMEFYIHQRNSEGQLVDPIMRFHEWHGANITKIVQGFRPADVKNETNGVLVEYEFNHRQERALKARNGLKNSANHTPSSNTNLADLLTQTISSLLPEAPDSIENITFNDLGLDSQNLIELAEILSSNLGVKIDTTFLFNYNSIQAICDKLEPQTSQDANENKSAPNDSNAPIAIIGMACRLPGDCNSPEDFWELLIQGKDALGEVPEDRWKADDYYSEENEQGRIHNRRGGFIKDIYNFDADFFNISPREAQKMDPQQRLALENTWHALENAGIQPIALKESKTGIFTGLWNRDYESILRETGSDSYDIYSATGGASSVAAGRIAYFLGTRGPTLTIDTACSSALVAIHNACQSLREGECPTAIVTAVNCILSPEISQSFSQAGVLSPDGKCHTFDEKANGYVRSEACISFILKPLSKAQEEGDRIHAVIRSSAVNQDGASNGLTAPSGIAQQEVIRSALKKANIQGTDVQLVEAHGTGTPLGDPIEFDSISQTYGQNRSQTNSLYLSSVKTNIGHTESAAGMAGMLKVILSLNHKTIPPHLNFTKPNPEIDLEAHHTIIPTNKTDWTSIGPRRGAISAFGFSGTNAHVIIEEAPITEKEIVSAKRNHHILSLSAKNQSALQEQASQLLGYVEKHSTLKIADLCNAANTNKSHFEYRDHLVSESIQDLAQKLIDVQNNSIAKTAKPEPLAFIFSGQGAQYYNMGHEFYKTQAVFRKAIDDCSEQIKTHLDLRLNDLLFNEETAKAKLDQTAYTQPALFAIEYALAQLWRSWGIEPQWVTGHSLGEYTAAVIAKVFSLEDAIKLVCARGRLMQSLPPTGGMAVIQETLENVELELAMFDGNVAIGAYNGPENVAITGLKTEVERVIDLFAQKGVKCNKLPISIASHCPLVEPMLAEFASICRTIRFSAPQIPLISNLTGKQVNREITDPDYWIEHIRQPVRFHQGMQYLIKQGCLHFIECGPRSTLTSMCSDSFSDVEGALWLPSLRSKEPNWKSMLNSLGQLYQNGHNINWNEVDSGYSEQKLNLPGYPFQRKTYQVSRQKGGKNKVSEGLLGAKIETPLNCTLFEKSLSQNSHPWTNDHQLAGRASLPGSAYIEIISGWLKSFLPTQQTFIISDLTINLPVFVGEDEINAQTVFDKKSDYSAEFEYYTKEHADDAWEKIVQAKIDFNPSVFCHQKSISPIEINALENRIDRFQRALQNRGLIIGEQFNRIHKLAVSEDEAFSEIPTTPTDKKWNLSPTLLDACLQTANALTPWEDNNIWLLSGIEKAEILKTFPEGTIYCQAKKVEANNTSITANLSIFSEANEIIAQLNGIRFKQSKSFIQKYSEKTPACKLMEIVWKKEKIVSPDQETQKKYGDNWIIIKDASNKAEQLYNLLHPQAILTTIKNLLKSPELIESGQIEKIIYFYKSNKSQDSLNEQLKLLQYLLQSNLKTSPQLVFVTEGIHPLNSRDEQLELLGSLSWGFAKSIQQEHPEFKPRVIDIPVNENVSEALLSQINAPKSYDAEAEILTSTGVLLTSHLSELQPQPSVSPKLKSDKAYLITGGTGGLGLLTAQVLIDQGAKFICLVSRSGDSKQLQETLPKLTQNGVVIRSEKVNITDELDVSNLFEKFGNKYPELAGIVHAAGTVNDNLLKNQNWNAFEEVLAPKVSGSWNLHNASQSKQIILDFFICYSTIFNVLGSAGVSNYVCANSYMDSLVNHRRKLGLPAQSIHWGHWDNVGMAESFTNNRKSQLEAKGILRVDVDEGKKALSDLLLRQEQQTAATSIDWPLYLKQFTKVPDFLEAFKKHQTEKKPEQNISLDELKTTSNIQKKTLISQMIAIEAASILGFPPDEIKNTNRGFLDMGMDSLTSIEFKNRLQKSFEQKLPATLIFRYPNIEKLSQFLKELLFPEVTQPAKKEIALPPKKETSKKEFDAMNELIDKELDELEGLLN